MISKITMAFENYRTREEVVVFYEKSKQKNVLYRGKDSPSGRKPIQTKVLNKNEQPRPKPATLFCNPAQPRSNSGHVKITQIPSDFFRTKKIPRKPVPQKICKYT